MRTKFALILFLLVTLTGCAMWEGFERGITGQDPTGEGTLSHVGEAAGYAATNVVEFLPSPWRELLVALISGATGWVASARKVEESK